MKEKIEKAVCVVALLAVLYVAAYFALARRGLTFQHLGMWAASPEYRGAPEIAFRSLHHLDRTVLRPRFWQGTYSADEQAQQMSAIAALLKADLKQP